jgi:hypothetical protein
MMMIDLILKYSMPLSLNYCQQTLAILQTLPVEAHALAFFDSSGSDDIFLDQLMTIMSEFKGRYESPHLTCA